MTAPMATDDPMPAGPFHVGLTWDFGAKTWMTPYTIRAANDQCVAGHIESKAMAQRIVALLNGG